MLYRARLSFKKQEEEWYRSQYLAVLPDRQFIHGAESCTRNLSQEAVLLVMDKLKLSVANRDLLAELRHCALWGSILLADYLNRVRGGVGRSELNLSIMNGFSDHTSDTQSESVCQCCEFPNKSDTPTVKLAYLQFSLSTKGASGTDLLRLSTRHPIPAGPRVRSRISRRPS